MREWRESGELKKERKEGVWIWGLGGHEAADSLLQ